MALFLLFVLLYSERVASHSCETLRELLHHPFKLYPLFNLSRKWKRWLPKILTKDKSSVLKYFMSFLQRKKAGGNRTKRRSTYQEVDIIKSIRHHGRLVLIKFQRFKPARNSFCLTCYTNKINISVLLSVSRVFSLNPFERIWSDIVRASPC